MEPEWRTCNWFLRYAMHGGRVAATIPCGQSVYIIWLTHQSSWLCSTSSSRKVLGTRGPEGCVLLIESLDYFYYSLVEL